MREGQRNPLIFGEVHAHRAAHNGLVGGSSPSRPTNLSNALAFISDDGKTSAPKISSRNPPESVLMPIRAEERGRYPKDWKAISLARRERAGWRCEGSPLYPDCRATNGEPHPVTGSKVVLTVAHLNHRPEDVAEDNLRAWCQRCHLTYDAEMHAAGRRERARAEMASGDLFSPSQESF